MFGLFLPGRTRSARQRRKKQLQKGRNPEQNRAGLVYCSGLPRAAAAIRIPGTGTRCSWHRQRSGRQLVPGEPAQLQQPAPAAIRKDAGRSDPEETPADLQKRQLQGLSPRRGRNTRGTAAGRAGRTGAAAGALTGRSWYPAQLQAIRKGRSWYQVNQGSNQGANYQKSFILKGLRVLKLQFSCNLVATRLQSMPRQAPAGGQKGGLQGLSPRRGRNTRGAAAGGSRPHRGSGRGIDGAAAGTRNRAQLQPVLFVLDGSKFS